MVAEAIFDVFGLPNRCTLEPHAFFSGCRHLVNLARFGALPVDRQVARQCILLEESDWYRTLFLTKRNGPDDLPSASRYCMIHDVNPKKQRADGRFPESRFLRRQKVDDRRTPPMVQQEVGQKHVSRCRDRSRPHRPHGAYVVSSPSAPKCSLSLRILGSGLDRCTNAVS
jgi:hypothetical protein